MANTASYCGHIEETGLCWVILEEGRVSEHVGTKIKTWEGLVGMTVRDRYRTGSGNRQEANNMLNEFMETVTKLIFRIMCSV